MRRALIACMFAACSFEHGVESRSDGPTSSGGDGDTALAVDAAPLGPWGTPTVVALPGSMGVDDDPSPTDDLLELYVNAYADVYVATRATTSDAWSTPVIVPLVSSVASETTPEVSYDGLTMIVASDRTGTIGGTDLWLSTRSSRTDAWGTPVRIVELSTTTAEAAGNMTPDGLAVVYSSYSKGNGSPDLFLAERATATDSWSTPIEITAVNTNGHEGSPFLSADKLTLYFDTDRAGSLDIYTSHRDSVAQAFPAPAPIDTINTPASEEDPWLSRDGRHLMYTSNRGGTSELWEAAR